MKGGEGVRTPIWATDDRIVADGPRSSAARHTKIGELHAPILVREDVRTFDISVDHTLVMEVHEPFEDLRDVHPDKRLRELAKLLADIMEGTVLAKPSSMNTEKQGIKTEQTYSRIMYRYSGVFSKPLYLTILACYMTSSN